MNNKVVMSKVALKAMKSGVKSMHDVIERQLQEAASASARDLDKLVVKVWNAALDEAANLPLEQPIKNRIVSLKKQPLSSLRIGGFMNADERYRTYRVYISLRSPQAGCPDGVETDGSTFYFKDQKAAKGFADWIVENGKLIKQKVALQK